MRVHGLWRYLRPLTTNPMSRPVSEFFMTGANVIATRRAPPEDRRTFTEIRRGSPAGGRQMLPNGCGLIARLSPSLAPAPYERDSAWCQEAVIEQLARGQRTIDLLVCNWPIEPGSSAASALRHAAGRHT
jgi:hypothetical protein